MRKENENMDLKELDSWLSTDEGAAWLESQKQPLINKRDELLKEISDQRSAVSNSNAKISEYEKSLSEERAIVERFVVDN
jgi:predicted  nucleic acid-binding Zn-ribbon protein